MPKAWNRKNILLNNLESKHSLIMIMISFDQSNDAGDIDVKMDGFVLEVK